MLHFTKCLFVLILTGFIFYGCKSKDDIAPTNTLSYDGKDVELSNGVLLDYGILAAGEGNAMELLLHSSGIKIHELAGKFDSTSGKGHIAYFRIFSSVANGLGEGDYVFDTKQSFKALTFIYMNSVFNGDISVGDGELHEATGGRLNVKKDGSNYILTFDCTDSAAKHIKGYYKGPIKAYDGR